MTVKISRNICAKTPLCNNSINAFSLDGQIIFYSGVIQNPVGKGFTLEIVILIFDGKKGKNLMGHFGL